MECEDLTRYHPQITPIRINLRNLWIQTSKPDVADRI
jgi:hypothetical protein